MEFTFDDQPMVSAFIQFLNAVKDKGDIPAALRNLHSKIAEKSVPYRAPVIVILSCCCYSFRYQRFSSFDQQDSEEVLRCLLDGIRMEEINVQYILYVFSEHDKYDPNSSCDSISFNCQRCMLILLEEHSVCKSFMYKGCFIYPNKFAYLNTDSAGTKVFGPTI